MQFNFIKKPYGFALFLTFIVLSFRLLTTLLDFYSKIIVSALIFMIASYIYTRFFKFKFSTIFLIKTLVWHFIFVFILPALCISFILGKETIKKLVGILIQLLIQSKATGALLIALFLITCFACSLLIYFSSWLGNNFGIKHIIKDNHMIRKYASTLFPLDKPIIFAAAFLFALIITRSILFIFLSFLGSSVLPPILAVSLLFFLIPLLVGLFSFGYTYFYQMQMTKKFKIKALANIAIILLIFTVFLILKTPMLKAQFLGDNPIIQEVTKFIVSTSLSIPVWILIFIGYFCITYGNKFALRFFKVNQTNVNIEA